MRASVLLITKEHLSSAVTGSREPQGGDLGTGSRKVVLVISIAKLEFPISDGVWFIQDMMWLQPKE